MRSVLLPASLAGALLVLVAPDARAVTFADGAIHVIDEANSYPFEGVAVANGPLGRRTTVNVVTGGQIGSPGFESTSEFRGVSVLNMSGGNFLGLLRMFDRSGASLSGGTLSGRIEMRGESGLAISGGVFALDALEGFEFSRIFVQGGEFAPDIHLHGRSRLFVSAGLVGGTVSASESSSLSVSGGEIASDVQLNDRSSLVVSGGSIGNGASSVRVDGAARVFVIGGEVTGDIRVRQGGAVSIQGGAILGALVALDDADVVLTGLGFDSPFGELTATTGTLRGTLMDGTPIDVPFDRASTASIQLVCPGLGFFSRTTPVLAAHQSNYCEDWNGVAQPGDDLSGAVLGLVKLSSANLAGATMDGADLRGADVSAANLSGASVSGTLFTGALYDGATRFPSGNTYDAPPWGLPGGASPWALGMTAATGLDTDGDLVPDRFDNCRLTDNGPNELGGQMDGDLDGYGNRCDADYNNDGAPNGGDFSRFVNAFNTFDAVVDLSGDGVVNGDDFGRFISSFSTLVGPSGLPCAGTIPCTP